MKKQFLGIKWNDETPTLRLYNKELNIIEYVNVPSYLEILRTEEKRCQGYFDLETKEYNYCKKFADMSISKYSSCVNCDLLSGFSTCLGCTGQHCLSKSSKAIRFCDESEHMVYLAYFPGNKLKVGTAAKYRKYERLIEQGALVSCFIANAPNGKLARDIEFNISKLNVSTKITATYKMKNLVLDKSIDDITSIFKNQLSIISENLTTYLTKYLISDIEINSFDSVINTLNNNLKIITEQTMFFGEDTYIREYDMINDPTEIIGNVVAVIGYLILIENHGKYFVYNTNHLKGYIISCNI